MKKIGPVFLLIIATSIAIAQTSLPDEKTAISTLRTFYTDYMSEFSTASGGKQFEDRLSELRSKYCTAKCKKQYKKLIEGTDSDPIIKGQDSDAKFAKTLSIKRDLKKSNVYDVSYFYYAPGKDGKSHKESVTIKLHVTRENGNFKIDEFL